MKKLAILLLIVLMSGGFWHGGKSTTTWNPDDTVNTSVSMALSNNNLTATMYAAAPQSSSVRTFAGVLPNELKYDIMV